MTALIDLHMHTHFSDGRPSPQELITAAAQVGLKTIAITDHDTLRGYQAALPLATEAGIDLIPAVEFTTRWDDYRFPAGETDVDVLGYFLDAEHPGLNTLLHTLSEDITGRVWDCCDHLAHMGYPLSQADVWAVNPRYAGWLSIIDALQLKGYANDYRSSLTIMMRAWKQVRSGCGEVGHVIDTIHAAGGVAVLAHPPAVKCEGERLTADQLAKLVAKGLDGIEIYHPMLDESARAYFLELAGRFGLAVTGGSDEHGWPAGFTGLGQQPVTPDLLHRLHARCSG